ncbi:ABC transporter substrate binding protein [Azospirillum rugosum]|uniref:ABC transport system substrate-binding protein n=1 Tax=Azospirillum rugosum TaxID=416170 RepID=A0ABS4SMG0_9PROT|nr:ABC transporter substrate binding protein [Azospirillum rugosum]MBP2293747.1 putative ABC transport system substrate-binding protein [Azospirillum rugosum]MDQ0527292.1 putative ABC transport system substrate-binding protein [Azospirillum rugosum]
MKAKILSALLASAMAVLPLSGTMAQQANNSVLMVLWKGQTEAEKAFKARLAELGVSVTYKEVNADQDRAKLANELRAIEGDISKKAFNGVYSYGTVATQVTTGFTLDATPVVFNIVFDPVAAKLVKSKDQPGVNVTGVTNGVPIATQFDAFTKLKPIKKLLVIFNAREPNSNFIEKEVAAWAEKNGVAMVSRRVAPDNNSLAEVLDEVASGKIEVDTTYSGADNYLASVAKEINAKIGNNVTLYGGTQTYVWAGWLAAYTPQVADMGIAAAEQMAKVLKGESAATLPVVLPQPKLFVSKSAAARQSVTPPADAVLEN